MCNLDNSVCYFIRIAIDMNPASDNQFLGKSLKSESTVLPRALLCLAVSNFLRYAGSGHTWFAYACACVIPQSYISVMNVKELFSSLLEAVAMNSNVMIL